MSFRGTKVRLRSIDIHGSEISWRLAYTDDEGIVHGTMAHSTIEPPEEIRAHVAALVAAITDYSTKLHFEGAQLEPISASGIAETLRRAPDPFGSTEEQG